MPDVRQQHKFHFSRRTLIIALVIIVLLAGWGIISRLVHTSRLDEETNEGAVITVKVTRPVKNAVDEETTFPGSVQAWHEAPIYARTNGYLKEWLVDIGTPVKKGQLLATIEAPEVDAQLNQAKADLVTAQANNKLAQSTATRWSALLKTDSVSKQEAEEKQSSAQANSALVASAKANVDRLRDLESFKRVVAPFDGIITARNTDNGALINSGSNGTAPELFHIADISKLRIYVQIPQNFAPAVKPDLKAELHFAEHAGKTYAAVLAKTANAIDPVSRTLLAQFETDNANGELFAGGYAEVHLKLGTFANFLRLPSNTLIYRGNYMQVAVVQSGKDNQAKAVLKKIIIGRDFGNDVEVTDGIGPDDQIILNPPDSLQNNQPVKIVKPGEDKPKDPGNKKDDTKPGGEKK